MGIVLIPTASQVIPQFGNATTFNTSGNYALPANASANSLVMVECIGGGGAGGPAQMYHSNNSDLVGGAGGAAGSYSIGVYRLGFYSNTVSGQNITVTVGAGGNGGTYNSTTNNGNSQSFYIGTKGYNSGGTSSVTFGGTTFASGAGGGAGGGNTYSNTSFMVGLDSTSLGNIAPKPGRGGSANYTLAGNFTGSNGADGKIEFNASASGAGNSATVRATGGGTGNSGNSATADTGAGGGGGGGSETSGATASATPGAAGNGASPGGGGGGGGGAAVRYNGGSFTVNAGSGKMGNGGSGRVRIWYSD